MNWEDFDEIYMYAFAIAIISSLAYMINIPLGLIVAFCVALVMLHGLRLKILRKKASEEK